MRTSILFATLSAFALAQGAVAADTTDKGNPATKYLTETNSNGVVTGQPEAVTSQPTVVTSEPAVVTSQQPAASIPAGMSTPAAGEPGHTTMTSVKSNTQTTSMVTVSGATHTGTHTTPNSNSNSNTNSNSNSQSASASASASATHTTNAAPLATAGSLGLVGLAALAAFL